MEVEAITPEIAPSIDENRTTFLILNILSTFLFLRMLGLEAPAVERVLADREILSRLETAAENEAFRLAISRYQALPELEQVETGITRDWFYRQEEVARAAVFNELGRSATWRERSSGGHLTSPLITRSPLTLSPGSRPGAVRFDPFWNQTSEES